MKNTLATDMSYFVAGLAAGGALALLFAPHSGEETRAQIKEGVEKGANALRRKSDEVMSQAREAVQTGKETVMAGRERARTEVRRLDDALHAGKEAYQRATEA